MATRFSRSLEGAEVDWFVGSDVTGKVGPGPLRWGPSPAGGRWWVCDTFSSPPLPHPSSGTRWQVSGLAGPLPQTGLNVWLQNSGWGRGNSGIPTLYSHPQNENHANPQATPSQSPISCLRNLGLLPVLFFSTEALFVSPNTVPCSRFLSPLSFKCSRLRPLLAHHLWPLLLSSGCDTHFLWLFRPSSFMFSLQILMVF